MGDNGGPDSGELERNAAAPEPKTEPMVLATDNDAAAEVQYTVFSKGERRLLTAIIGLTMIFSPLTANIYFPGIDQIKQDLSSTTELINLTITVYLVVSGLSPMFFSNMADSIGRRPVFLSMFAIYVVANLALALQNSYAALLVLRMLQSLGCSATIAISYGVISDVTTPAERGTMQGMAATTTQLGTVVAPVIGGALVSSVGWHWTFWFLLICGAASLVILVLWLPETARKVVGNGAVWPHRAWQRPLVSVLKLKQIPAAGRPPTDVHPGKMVLGLPNPLPAIRVLFYRDAALILLVSGVFYLIYYCIQASISVLLIQIYSLPVAAVGACYLAIGGGTVVGGYLNGKLMNYNYKQQARIIGHTVDRIKGDDLGVFPIERARTRSMLILNILHLGLLVGYGWALERTVHISVPLILQFCLGALEAFIFQTHSTLLVDVFPDQPSTAAAAGNIVRASLAAGGVAAMDSLLDRLGTGWYFTMLALAGGLVGFGGGALIWMKGMQWRLRRWPTT
ncbi:major facilitator superfamily domain-containing protein [Xylariales sp. PMI_506]|nr:major facilitator superfamily domain-containing protein [Xylariales sp. PMI_506]